jgi:flavodoxin
MIKKFILVCLVIFSFCIVYVSTIKASEEVSEKGLSVISDNETITVSDNKTLILYYSKTGKTKIVAEELNHLMPGSALVEVKSDASIPAAIFWYKLPFTKAKIEPLNIDFDDYEKIFLCTPVYLQGISPAIKAVIKDIPLEDKNATVIAICGGFYGSFMQWFVKNKIKSKGAEVEGIYVVKVGGKTNEEIEEQTATHLKTVLKTE